MTEKPTQEQIDAAIKRVSIMRDANPEAQVHNTVLAALEDYKYKSTLDEFYQAQIKKDGLDNLIIGEDIEKYEGAYTLAYNKGVNDFFLYLRSRSQHIDMDEGTLLALKELDIKHSVIDEIITEWPAALDKETFYRIRVDENGEIHEQISAMDFAHEIHDKLLNCLYKCQGLYKQENKE